MCEINKDGIIDLENDENFKLCEDERFKGLDRHAAQTWIYPTNLPLRQYQYDIVQTALFHNTMVSLPTGLGKTMIAAVIIYNMYRWYPLGKIIFMAPTRPLVCQQADACKKITCIPSEHTAQLTGDVQSMSRGPIWEKMRVFFLTPQILQRDLQSKICPAHLIRCIVIDEAHRARGNHAYCEVMRLLGDNAARIRVLALSATPGATPVQVAEVARVLRIARLEVRTESSEDVKPYLFSKTVETVVVSLNEPLLSIKDEYIQILDQYTRRLMRSGVLTGSAGNIHKGRIFMVQKEYKAHCERVGKRPDSAILQDLTFCLTLYHAYDVLVKHGLRGFLSFYDDHGGDKGWVRKNEQLTNLLERIRDYLGPSELNTSVLPDGTIPEIDENLVFGHPKYYKLREIVQKHFQIYPDTRVMVFCEYRDSVQEAFAALLTCRPLIRPRMFLGQSAISQKQQLTVMAKFRKGECNTLICTCVAEEGLDVAAVQLIICFDIANRSPIRLAQRMGRTGRHQTGRIVILVTEGREQQTLSETLQQSSLLDERLLQSPIVRGSMLPDGPPILPADIQPQCLRLHMTPVASETSSSNIKDVKHKKLLEKLNKKMIIDDEISWDGNLPSDNNIPVKSEEYLWKYSKNELDDFTIANSNKSTLKFFLNNFKEIHNSVNLIEPSLDTQTCNFLHKRCEELKFNLPSNFQNLKKSVKTKNRDIREMFGSSSQSQKDYNDFIITPEEDKNTAIAIKKSKLNVKKTSFLLNLQSELNTRRNYELLIEKTCLICDKQFNCSALTQTMQIDKEIAKVQPSIPDDNILNYLNYENLSKFNVQDMFADQNVQNNYRSHFNFETYNNEILFEKLRKNSNVFDKSIQIFQNDSLNPILTLADPRFSHEMDVSDVAHKEITFNDTSFCKNIDNLEISGQINDTKSFLNVQNDISTYVTDEISKKALIFFGLTCLEDLFIDNNDNSKNGGRMSYNSNGHLNSTTVIENQNYSFDNNISDESLNDLCLIEQSTSFNVKKSQQQEMSPITSGDDNITYNKNEAKMEKSMNNFVLWDESLFLDDSEILPEEQQHEKSPILCSQRPQIKSNNSPMSPILGSQHIKTQNTTNSSKISQYSQQQISPISSQRVTSLNNVSRKLNLFNIPKIDIDYISDDDLFADDNLDDKLFEVAKSASKCIENKENTPSPPQSLSSPPKQNLKSKNIFQLKHSTVVSGENSKQNNTENNFDDDDDDDLSLCDFVTPIKKRLKLSLQKPRESSSTNTNISSPETTPVKKSINNFDKLINNTIDLSQFSFQNKKQFGKTNNYEDYKNTHSQVLSVEILPKNGKQQQKKRKKLKCSFIDTEAEVSDDDDLFDDDDDSDENDDELNTSFVNDDHTELTQANVDMQAYYLKSVKSPQNGKFKIPKLPDIRLEDICSQIDYKDDSHYVQDSFCGETIITNNELSLLEIAEMKLEEKRKSLKRQKFNRNETKRRRIQRISSESSSGDEEDELKKLREECMKNQSIF